MSGIASKHAVAKQQVARYEIGGCCAGCEFAGQRPRTTLADPPEAGRIRMILKLSAAGAATVNVRTKQGLLPRLDSQRSGVLALLHPRAGRREPGAVLLLHAQYALGPTQRRHLYGGD